MEIKRRITLANRCFFNLNKQFRNRVFSCMTKRNLYKALSLFELLYDAEACTLLSTYAAALRLFVRKVLRMILGAVQANDDFTILSNSKLYDIDVRQHINI